MKNYIPVKLEDLDLNAWQAFGEDWVAIAAGGRKHANAMTASWGSIGVVWGKPAVTIYMRPQRYTRGFVEKKGRFSINFLPAGPESRKALRYIGEVSGRDEDKLANAGLTLAIVDKTPVLEQADLVLNCRVMYRSQIESNKFIDREFSKKLYPEKDYHYVYVGEIISAYRLVEAAPENTLEENS
ncbi:MAG: flavin reductase family protein [Clostridiaceae bacterium]|nr:flavin reductase family protein [Clostridiaceae bacterium]